MNNVIQYPKTSLLNSILKDLEDCHKSLVSLKKDYHPMYRNLLIFWTNRRQELKAQLEKQIKYKPMFEMLKNM